jgi:glycosyltransferase involved in cell wall biosynthesis
MIHNLGGDAPLVSAVIPTHNRPDFVRRAVRSVLEQTYPNVEAVVVVDGPDEATVSALKHLTDARVRIVELRENVGGSEARNIGIRESRGEFVGLLDDDDEWLPEKTEKQMSLLSQSKFEGALVVSQYFARSSDGSQICFPPRFPEPEQPISEYMFAPHSGFQTSTFFCRRGRALQIPFTPGLAGCQDLDWFLRIMTAPNAELAVVAEPLAIFNIPENQPSTSRMLGWRKRLNWGRSKRNLMTRRGYSAFVARVCLVKMIEEGFSARDLMELLHEYFVVGQPNPSGALRIAISFLLPVNLKEMLRRRRRKWAYSVTRRI